MVSVFHARPHWRFKDIKSNLRRKKLYRMNKDINFLGEKNINRKCKSPNSI